LFYKVKKAFDKSKAFLKISQNCEITSKKSLLTLFIDQNEPHRVRKPALKIILKFRTDNHLPKK
jgi:hypothetical protein